MVIPPTIRAELRRHAESEAPNEACGFLAGTGDVVTAFYPVRNEDASGAADIAAAKALQSDIAQEYARYGVQER